MLFVDVVGVFFVVLDDVVVVVVVVGLVHVAIVVVRKSQLSRCIRFALEDAVLQESLRHMHLLRNFSLIRLSLRHVSHESE